MQHEVAESCSAGGLQARPSSCSSHRSKSCCIWAQLNTRWALSRSFYYPS